MIERKIVGSKYSALEVGYRSFFWKILIAIIPNLTKAEMIISHCLQVHCTMILQRLKDISDQSEPERVEAVEPVANSATNIRGQARGRGRRRGVSCSRAVSLRYTCRPLPNRHSPSAEKHNFNRSLESLLELKR